MRTFAVGTLAFTLFISHACLGQSQIAPLAVADLVLVHGKVWTGVPTMPEAEAVAVGGTHILAVGTSDAMLKLAVPGAKIIELNGRRVLPGFNDAHVHVTWGGEQLVSVHLTDAASQSEFRARIAAFAKSAPNSAWIVNGSWDHERWTPVALPTHQLIDDLTPNNPVAVTRTDGHMLLANAVAMKLAGIDKSTKDVPGGVIVRDADGNPTGIFKDAAVPLILKMVPEQKQPQIEAEFLAAQKVAAENGVTSFQDMAILDDKQGPTKLRALEALQREGKLKIRVAENFRLSAGIPMAELGIQADFKDGLFHIGGLKSFADGGLGASTAWFFEPYTDSPANHGIAGEQMQDQEKLYQEFKKADQAGLQLITHAIGDRANHEILNMYERLEQEDGTRDRRLRIEHAQHLKADDIARFASLHVIASVQPFHAIDDGRWAEKRIGPERIKTTYAFRSLIDAGATVAFGSDWPVAPLSPLIGIYAAATRRTIDGKNPDGWQPQQKVTVAEAVKAYTYGAAFAEGEEQVKGTIEAGKLADLIVLAEDIFAIDPVRIEKVKVDSTFLGGTLIYQRTDADAKH
jgi:predicted amidohydrolase YtcJ